MNTSRHQSISQLLYSLIQSINQSINRSPPLRQPQVVPTAGVREITVLCNQLLSRNDILRRRGGKMSVRRKLKTRVGLAFAQRLIDERPGIEIRACLHAGIQLDDVRPYQNVAGELSRQCEKKIAELPTLRESSGVFVPPDRRALGDELLRKDAASHEGMVPDVDRDGPSAAVQIIIRQCGIGWANDGIVHASHEHPCCVVMNRAGSVVEIGALEILMKVDEEARVRIGLVASSLDYSGILLILVGFEERVSIVVILIIFFIFIFIVIFILVVGFFIIVQFSVLLSYLGACRLRYPRFLVEFCVDGVVWSSRSIGIQ
mmetsp:Transcript_1601/g.4378  ORF Transcript_1601/g.4378 Transcript_1601/m.4378 type:complete len:317 (+) Transcript_1601:209-1159(+)